MLHEHYKGALEEPNQRLHGTRAPPGVHLTFSKLKDSSSTGKCESANVDEPDGKEVGESTAGEQQQVAEEEEKGGGTDEQRVEAAC